MKSLELTLLPVGTRVLYGCYLYYLAEMGNEDKPTNLWFNLGKGIDEFFFNSGVKPKEAIEDSPGRIEEYINNNL